MKKIKERIKKVELAIALSALIVSKPINVFANNYDNLKANYKQVGNPEFTLELYDVIDNLDEGLKSYFDDKNLNILILEGSRAADVLYCDDGSNLNYSIMGFTDYNKNTIYIEGVSYKKYYDKYPESSEGLSKEDFCFRIVRDTLLHELGHYVDGYSDFSQSEKFHYIYEREKRKYTMTDEFKIDNLGIMTNIESESEYFATAFSCYVSYPNSLNKRCPKTYEYFDNIVKQFREVYNIVDEDEIKGDNKYSKHYTKYTNNRLNNTPKTK